MDVLPRDRISAEQAGDAKTKGFENSKGNYFKRGFNIGKDHQAEVFVLIKKNGVSYTFTNTDMVRWPAVVRYRHICKLQSNSSRIRSAAYQKPL
jgi:hypothetical protein